MKYTFKQINANLDDDSAQSLIREMSPSFKSYLANIGFVITTRGVNIANDRALFRARKNANRVIRAYDLECDADSIADAYRTNVFRAFGITSDDNVDYHGGFVLMLCDAIDAI